MSGGGVARDGSFACISPSCIVTVGVVAGLLAGVSVARLDGLGLNGGLLMGNAWSRLLRRA